MTTVFQKILRRELPADIVYEDELCLAIKDIAPQAPFHILIIPKKPIVSLAHVGPEDTELLGHLLFVTSEIAESLGLKDRGYRTIINTGEDGGQTVDHLHIHLLGGRKLTEAMVN
jgi:histidine triad (HIT) family protein